MKRSKRFAIRRIAVVLAAVLVLAPVAQAKPTPRKAQEPTVEIPYLSHGVLKAQDVAIAPDDLSLSRPTNAGSAVGAESSGGLDVSPAVISGFGLALVLLMGGSALAIRHSRKTRLSPA